MSQDRFTVDEHNATEYGLASLYAYGWGFEKCYEECAKLTSEISDVPEEQQYYEQVLRNIKENMCIDSCVEVLIDHTTPSEKAGFFEINGKLSNPIDGHSLLALEILYRSYLDLSGKLEDMDYDISSVLNTENAQSFFSDWVNAKENEPVTIRGIGGDFPLYFLSSEENGDLPVLDKSKMLNSISEKYLDIPKDVSTEIVEDIYDGIDHARENLKLCLEVRQQWGKVIGVRHQQDIGLGIS